MICSCIGKCENACTMGVKVVLKQVVFLKKRPLTCIVAQNMYYVRKVKNVINKL